MMILVLALLVRLPIALSRAPAFVSGAEATHVAVSMVRHGSFSDAFGPGTGPTAHLLPLNILIQAGVLKAFGVGRHGSLALVALACLEVALGLAMLPWIGAHLFANRRLGVCAGLIGALVPFNWWPQASGEFEAPLASFMLALTLAVYARYFSLKRLPGVTGSVAVGIVSGLCLLTTASMLPVFALLFGYGCRVFKAAFAAYARFSAVAIAAALVVLLPWACRNYAVFHDFVPLRNNFGLELQVSNNDQAAPVLEKNLETMKKIHPYGSERERQELAALGEVAYNKAKLRQAGQWIAANPGKFLSLSLRRVLGFWFPEYGSVYQWCFSLLVTVLAFVALGVLLVRGETAGIVALAYLAGFSGIYAVVQSSCRYRLPVESILLLLCAYFLLTILPGATAGFREKAGFGGSAGKRGRMPPLVATDGDGPGPGQGQTRARPGPDQQRAQGRARAVAARARAGPGETPGGGPR